MSKHVIVGAGQIGGRLASALADAGHEVVLVTRSGSGPVAEGITRVPASAADDAVMRQISAGAEVLYNCANPRYHEWERDWPPMANSMIKTAEATGAVLVTL